MPLTLLVLQLVSGKDLDELHDKARVERTFTPDNDEEKRERRYRRLEKSQLRRSLEWAKEDGIILPS